MYIHVLDNIVNSCVVIRPTLLCYYRFLKDKDMRFFRENIRTSRVWSVNGHSHSMSELRVSKQLVHSYILHSLF